MSKRFENKKLNKEDHAKVDKEAGIARGAAKVTMWIAAVGFIIKTKPWEKIVDAAKKLFSRM